MFSWSSGIFWCSLCVCLCVHNFSGILQHFDGTVLKQLQPPPRGPREMNFYTQVLSTPQNLTMQQQSNTRSTLPQCLHTYTYLFAQILYGFLKVSPYLNVFFRCLLKTVQIHTSWPYNNICPNTMAHGHLQINQMVRLDMPVRYLPI